MNIFNPDGTKRPAFDTDRIRLGQRIEAAEARSGEPSPQRILAERAVEAIRAGGGSLEEIHKRCDAADLFLVIEDKESKNGIRYSGFVKAGDGTGLKVNLWALPKDCSAHEIMKRTSEPTEKAPAPKPEKLLTANQAKYHARQIFKSSSSMEEAEQKLAAKTMRIERYGKSGGYLVFGPGEDQKMKLSELGGKYSLSALQKRYNGQGSNDNAFLHGSQSKVKQSSIEHASNFADRAADRASSANDRAISVAAEGVQARTITEALDDAQQQAVALDAARKAKAVAAKAKEQAATAEKRAQTAEDRLKQMQTPIPEKTSSKTTVDNKEKIQKSENPTQDTQKTETALKSQNSVNPHAEKARREAQEHARKMAQAQAQAKAKAKPGHSSGHHM